MDDRLRVWTTVGSAGTLNQTDLAKVSLHQSIIQLGMELPETAARSATARSAAAARVDPALPTERAVVRYNVNAVDGVSPFSRPLQHRYHFLIRYRGHVSAKLMKVDITRGIETQILLFDSSTFPPAPGFKLESVSSDAPLKHDSEGWDLVEMAYYVEATLTTPAFVIGRPAAISAITLIVARDSGSSRNASARGASAHALIQKRERA